MARQDHRSARHAEPSRLQGVALRPRVGRSQACAVPWVLVILDSLDVTAEQFAAGTGWEMKPEGACKAEVCVPLDQSEGFDLVATVARLGMSLVRDEQAGLWAVGPESLGGRALVSAEAPELVLDDVNGNEFRLSSLRGQKVVVVSWAPY